MLGAAAGIMIFQKFCQAVTPTLRPTLIRVEETPWNPCSTWIINGITPGRKPMMISVISLRPKITRKSGYSRKTGAANSASSQREIPPPEQEIAQGQGHQQLQHQGDRRHAEGD